VSGGFFIIPEIKPAFFCLRLPALTKLAIFVSKYAKSVVFVHFAIAN
jgi:hypothetical protein